ncbi:MAG: flippase [bacterium]|nr:flippase [bacterium]
MTFSKVTSFLFQNQTPRQTVLKNALWLTVGQTSGRLLRAVVVIYAARLLGASSWGAFSYALSLSAFLTIFSDIGITSVVTREASRNVELRRHYLATAFVIKIALLLPLIAAFLLLAPLLTNVTEVLLILPVIVALTAFDSLQNLASSMARATERMELEAGVNIFTNIAIVALGFALLVASPTSLSLAFAYAVGSALGLLAYVVVLRDYFVALPRFFSRELVKPILTAAWPFGLMGLMGVVMINTDVIMIGFFRGIAEVGFYAAAQKPILLLYILPGLLITPLFPSISRLARENRDKLRAIFEKALHVMLAGAIPLTISGFLYAPTIINLLYGAEYAAGVESFRILALTFFMIFSSTLIGNVIFAFDKQRSFLIYVALGFFGNVALNALLIPRFGIEGTAISTVINNITTTIYAWRTLKSVMPFTVLPRLLKTLLAGALMATSGLLFYLFGVPPLPAMIATGLIYPLALFILKDPLIIELRSFFR